MNTRVKITALTAVLLITTSSGAAAGTSIHEAARLGNLARVNELLDADPGLVQARTAAGETPLHFAASSQRTAVVELLLSRGADVNASDDKGITPLHLAATSFDAKLTQMLLDAGADLWARDEQGETALHSAARRLNAEVVQLLIEAGADVSARNNLGETPLRVLGREARSPEQIDLLYDQVSKLLIANGAESRLREIAGVPAEPEGENERGPRAGYRTWPEIEQLMADWAADYPDICELHDLGTSVQGRHLWALRITDNLSLEEDEPEFKYIANMHGNEWMGYEMCLYLIDYLLTNYGTDPRVTDLVDEIDIWIVPSMNPDGLVLNRRENYNWVDLNRNFPEWTNGDSNSTVGRQPETAVIMNWGFANSFTLSANFHGGALVVNYPFDNDGMGSVNSPTPDDDMFIWISEEYSQHNLPMWNSPSFYHGITNGAAWYAIDGGMQDWNYRYMGNNEVTIEISNDFQPPASQIPDFWDDNRAAMLTYMDTCLIGVRGLVTDASTGAPLFATVTVTGRDHEVYTDPDVGDYHRMLLPGTYELNFEADGYETLVVSDVVVSSGDATRLDVGLGSPAQIVSPNGGEVLDAGVETSVTWDGSPSAQFHVQYTANYGDIQAVYDGFESGSFGPEYSTGGNADWFVTTSDAYSGSYSAQAGDIGNNNVSWLTRNVDGGGVGFWYRVSSEEDYDWFNFYVDGTRLLHVSGEANWTLYTTTLADGPHELKWEYTKDVSLSSGSDTVWIDDLELSQDNTTWTDIVALTGVGETSTPWTPTVAGTDYKVRVQAYYGSGYGVWDESDGVFEVTDGASPGDFDGDGDVDRDDYLAFKQCFTGPGGGPIGPGCSAGDFDLDDDIDCDDWVEFQTYWTGPPASPPALFRCDAVGLHPVNADPQSQSQNKTPEPLPAP